MKEVIRVRCPCCGMLPTVDNLAVNAKKHPAKVRIVLQRFGGKKKAEWQPLEGLKQGGAPGIMEYEDVTDSHPEAVKSAENFFDRRIREYQEGKGK